MMRTVQSDRTWEQGPVAIRPLRSLTSEALKVVANVVCALPGNWGLEHHDDYEGYLSVLISAAGDSDAPTYLISGPVGQIELAKFERDELHTLGRFEDIEFDHR